MVNSVNGGYRTIKARERVRRARGRTTKRKSGDEMLAERTHRIISETDKVPDDLVMRLYTRLYIISSPLKIGQIQNLTIEVEDLLTGEVKVKQGDYGISLIPQDKSYFIILLESEDDSPNTLLDNLEQGYIDDMSYSTILGEHKYPKLLYTPEELDILFGLKHGFERLIKPYIPSE